LTRFCFLQNQSEAKLRFSSKTNIKRYRKQTKKQEKECQQIIFSKHAKHLEDSLQSCCDLLELNCFENNQMSYKKDTGKIRDRCNSDKHYTHVHYIRKSWTNSKENYSQLE
jgi:hypothetical protein